jgi:hypothetical protein
MDWTLAIDRNRAALKRILSELLGMAGLRGQFTFFPQEGALPQDVALAEKGKGLSPALGSPATLPRRLHRAVLRLLRPAESAARRLVVVAARDIVVTLPPPRPRKPGRKSAFLRHGATGTGIILPKGVRPPDASARSARRTWSLPFADPPRRVGLPRPKRSTVSVPRISVPGVTRPAPIRPRPAPHDPVDATRLALRLKALASVLDDLPAHAMRFARRRARAEAETPAATDTSARVARRMRCLWPLRAGRAPGSLKRARHEVHEVLKDMHYFAWATREQPDTS